MHLCKQGASRQASKIFNYFFRAAFPSGKRLYFLSGLGAVAVAVAVEAVGGVCLDMDNSPINPVIVPVPPVEIKRVPPLSWLCMMRYAPATIDSAPKPEMHRTTKSV